MRKINRLICIDVEPTHYKADLWNTISNCEGINLEVIYTQAKNWAPDGGHNYLRFPIKNYKNIVLGGKGFFGGVSAAIYVIQRIMVEKPDIVIVCGYNNIQTILASFFSFFVRTNLVLWTDVFNNRYPSGRFRTLKWVFRELLRKFYFTFGQAVFVCGRLGVNSAVQAGCRIDKIHDFPYVIDSKRIQTDMPEKIPEQCLQDLKESAPVLFFSGRMIARKGLPSLLQALASEELDADWILWIEGDGPEIENYVLLAARYGVADRCRFLGFCQYDLHSWLVRSSDIVIVPSLEDNWGIVVDEGLQLGKIVVSSDATGSGADRIVDGVNGFLFQAGDSVFLAALLKRLIVHKPHEVEQAARCSPKNVTPADNLKTLLGIVSTISK